jgi:hypothetical protein
LPAVRHAFTDNPLPAIIVADSSFILEALIDSGQGRHAPARAFANRLIQVNCLLLYSLLLFLEAPQCWRRLYRRGILVPSQRSIDPVTDRVNAFGLSRIAAVGLLQRAMYSACLIPVVAGSFS